MKYIILLIVLLLNTGISFCQKNGHFETGCTVLVDDYRALISGKRVGLITNKTGVDKNRTHISEILLENSINITKIFTPEHGFSADDIYEVSRKDIPVISLYSGNYSIKAKDAEDVDIFVFDIQDLGVRFYTYTSTLYIAMHDAVKLGKEFIICDRPAVANLNYSGGFMLNSEYESFVGKIPVPVIYGLTIGELANYLNAVYVKNENFHVVKMKDYKRLTKYEDVLDFWINPSPSIVTLESARLYPSLCFLEGTNISEGRGTSTPFQVFGAPFIDADKLLRDLNSYNLPGIKFNKAEFIPDQNLLPAYNTMKYVNKTCYGIKMEITDLNLYCPFETSVAVLISLKNNSDDFKWNNKNFIDKLAGTGILRNMINEGKSLEDIIEYQRSDVKNFREAVSFYMLYD